jgi:predicted MFS family arabinose efflux permease
MILLGCLALVLFVIRDGLAADNRMLPAEVTDFSHAIGSGILGTLLLCISIMSFIVYGPLILIELYGLTPLEAGLVVLLETLAWGSAAIIFSGTSQVGEPRLIKSGGCLVLLGLIAMAFVFPRGWLWAVVLSVIVLNGGFGMMWGFIIKRIIGAASADDKDRTASLLPITQQTGFALGAALCGVVANGFGINETQSLPVIQEVAFWLFAGFVPLALLGNFMVWRFVSAKAGSSQKSDAVEIGPAEQ